MTDRKPPPFKSRHLRMAKWACQIISISTLNSGGWTDSAVGLAPFLYNRYQRKFQRGRRCETHPGVDAEVRKPSQSIYSELLIYVVTYYGASVDMTPHLGLLAYSQSSARSSDVAVKPNSSRSSVSSIRYAPTSSALHSSTVVERSANWPVQV